MYQVKPTTVEHTVWRSSHDLSWSIVGYMVQTGAKSGMVLGALYGTAVLPLIGTILGAVFGLLGGMALGFLSGAVMAGVTRAWFYPSAKMETYGNVMQVVVSGVNILCGLAIALWSPDHQGGLLAISSRSQMHQSLAVLTGLQIHMEHWVVLPTVIAALAPLYWRQRYIRWYVDNV